MIHVCDAITDDILAFYDAEVLEAFHDENLDYVETFEATFDITEKASYLSQRNRVVIPADDGMSYREFIIDEIDGQHDQISIRCTSSYLDLDKQKIIAPQTRYGQTIEAVAGFILDGTEVQLGNVDYRTAKTIKFKMHMGGFQALKQVASEMGREMVFRVEINGNKISGRYVDFLESRGFYRGKEVVFGKDLLGLRRLENSEAIVTALFVVGPQKQDGTRVTASVYNSDVFDRWSRNGQQLWAIYEPQSVDQAITYDELKELGTAELEKRINSVVQYEISQLALESIEGFEHEKVLLGDTERIKDEGYSPPLYAEARAIQVRRNLIDASDKTFTLGEYIEYSADEVRARFRELLDAYGFKILRSPAAPDGQYGVIWMDTSQTPNVANTWDGEAWVRATPITADEVGAETPEGAQQKADQAEENANAYTDSQMRDFVEVSTYNQDIAAIQSQIDKNITSWFYGYDPTLTNLPASEWATNEKKNTHLGDLFYNTETGHAFRFMLDENNNYVWTLLQDSDVAAALEAAQQAVDTADSKRRVFVSTPVPPYDVGDLWTSGDSIYRAIVAKSTGQSYAFTDWELVADVTSENTAADTSAVGGTPAETVTETVDNFNDRNDRIATKPATPVIATNGTAVDHTINKDASCDISFEWTFNTAGEAGDIDGFLVYVRQSTSSAVYTFGTTPAEETLYVVTKDKRAMIFYGIPADKYYTFGVQAYRNVDQDIDASGMLKSDMAKATASGENPYRPAENVAFGGSITGTVNTSALVGVINPEVNNIAGATSRVVWDASGITVTDENGNSSTSISKDGVSVKNGAFTLEDDISDQAYSIVRKKNFIRDHSFELLEGNTKTWNGTNLFMDYEEKLGTNKDWYGAGTGGLPKLIMPWNTESVHASPFGDKSMLVNLQNFIVQSIRGLRASQTYTISAFFRKHPNLAAGIPRMYVRQYEDATPKVLWSTSKDFATVTDELVRYAITFTLPASYTEGGGLSFDLFIQSANASWVQVDGVQMVEGDLPIVYDPEDSLWDVVKGKYGVLSLKMAPSSYYSEGKGVDMRNSDLYNVNHITINDPGNGEGIEWTGGNGFKIVEAPNDMTNGAGNLQFAAGNTRRLTMGSDGVLNTQATYDRTYSYAANLYITSNGYLGRATSARKYKLCIEPVEGDFYRNILQLHPQSWFDKTSAEAYANALTRQNRGEKVDWENEDLPFLDRTYGLVAEDVEAAGLAEYVTYGRPNAEGIRPVEGLAYERLWTLLIPLVRENDTRIKTLEENAVVQLETIQLQAETIEAQAKAMEAMQKQLDTLQTYADYLYSTLKIKKPK